jgi:hemerythrin-like domain-containing protein
MAKKEKELNAVDLLSQQHREVEKLFAAFEKAEDAEDKEALFEEIADKLAVHTKIEEQIFYPAVREKKTEDMVMEAFVEHTSAKRLLADLMESDPSEGAFDAQMKVLKEQIEHHVEEEEGQLFPAAKKVLGKEELVALAQEMTALQTELEGTDPRPDRPEEVAASPPGGG